MARSIVAMHFAMEVQERLVEEALGDLPPGPGEPAEQVLLFNVYRHAKRKSRRNPDGLIFLHTSYLSVRQAQGIAGRGYVLKYYETARLKVFDPLEEPAVERQHTNT